MNLHFSALIIVELLPDGRLDETTRTRLSVKCELKRKYVLIITLDVNIMWNTIQCRERVNFSARCRWQTEWVPCQRESVWSTACLLSDHSLGRLWLPHTRGTAGFFVPVVLQLWVFDSATTNREFLCQFNFRQTHDFTHACLLWMCCLTFLVSRRLISLTSACLSAWFLAGKKRGKKEQQPTELYSDDTWKPGMMCKKR